VSIIPDWLPAPGTGGIAGPGAGGGSSSGMITDFEYWNWTVPSTEEVFSGTLVRNGGPYSYRMNFRFTPVPGAVGHEFRIYYGNHLQGPADSWYPVTNNENTLVFGIPESYSGYTPWFDVEIRTRNGTAVGPTFKYRMNEPPLYG
jgi:hypothetical protein